jgi:hypothetical protein
VGFTLEPGFAQEANQNRKRYLFSLITSDESRAIWQYAQMTGYVALAR